MAERSGDTAFHSFTPRNLKSKRLDVALCGALQDKTKQPGVT
jgi:hypothetical protein